MQLNAKLWSCQKAPDRHGMPKWHDLAYRILAVVKDVGTDLHSIPARKKRLNLSVMCWMKS